ncbi:MAG: isoprenylcysteine carboxylmethyltransferase family protein [Leptospiraceae bacterium]|nr:isoprenylcysteine carboxylmethyltransferase family protein [Leptospiraceae bacterium]MCP5503112.1 isoprenylcysteine carboxylmethyltransferase family protein [Leptospiraceae bacterium]
MRYVSIGLIILFYIFFFLRALILKNKIGRSIKANDLVLNIAILCAGISSFLFILQMTVPSFGKYIFTIPHIYYIEIAGTILIAIGLIFSTIASLNLGNSWRVGVHEQEKTSLVTTGIYKISRNPYFFFYDIVLIGLSLSSFSMIVTTFSLATIILFHLLILKEEKYLDSVHGDDYKKYKKETRRYI